MKRILLVAIALCFVFAGSYETFSQKRKIVKQPVKRKLVKCRVNGKVVYRAKCRFDKTTDAETVERYRIPFPESTINGQGGGLGDGRGTGQGNGAGFGSGSGNGNGSTEQQTTIKPESNVQPDQLRITRDLQINSKPRAQYTDAARQNMVQGTITLRVQFLANGQIGSITPVKGLGYGLTQQAINAAKGIKFEPAKRKGKPYTVVRIVSYSFTIY